MDTVLDENGHGSETDVRQGHGHIPLCVLDRTMLDLGLFDPLLVLVYGDSVDIFDILGVSRNLPTTCPDAENPKH